MKKISLISFVLFLFLSLNAMQKEETNSDVIFLVMETSDLDPKNSTILDVAALVVDSELTYVKKEVYNFISHSQESLNSIHPYKRPRIVESGLHEKVQSRRACSLQDVSDQIVRAFGEQTPEQHKPILAGDSSIKLNQQFLNEKMPRVVERLSLKEPINVISIRTAIKQLHPDDPFAIKRSTDSLGRAHALFEAFKYYK